MGVFGVRDSVLADPVRLSGPRGVPDALTQLLSHLPVFQLPYKLIYRVGVVGGEGSPGFGRELTDVIVYQYPVQEAGSLPVREPSADQPPVLGDLRPHGAPAVKSPFVEALGPGGEALSIVGQYRFSQGRLLAGALRHQILAGLLCGSGEEGGQDVGPLVLRPALLTCCPLKDLQVGLHVVVRTELGEAAGRGGGRGRGRGLRLTPTACCVRRSTASRRRTWLSAVSLCVAAARSWSRC